MDLTTLPPLHYNVAWAGNEPPERFVGRFMVVWRHSVNTRVAMACKKPTGYRFDLA
jgi:hypothetical protein